MSTFRAPNSTTERNVFRLRIEEMAPQISVITATVLNEQWRV